jgi:large subunit ribosomal protein L2
MPVKKYKPYTPSRRFMQVLVNPELVRDNKPEKSLVVGKRSTGGRNAHGRVTLRFRGGGHKRKLRLVDFLRDNHGVPGVVKQLEYDPGRSANIALIFFKDGDKRYILAPNGLKPGDEVVSGPDAPVSVGNAMPLYKLPLGAEIHNIEMIPGQGGKVARGAGITAQLLAREGGWVQVRMPSGEMRRFNPECYATIGAVGNFLHESVDLGKAGRSRWVGRRPHVRGTVQNPCDHPHGGGEGKSNSGRPPCSPWGVQSKGYRTRKKRNPTDTFIIRRRKKGRAS